MIPHHAVAGTRGRGAWILGSVLLGVAGLSAFLWRDVAHGPSVRALLPSQGVTDGVRSEPVAPRLRVSDLAPDALDAVQPARALVEEVPSPPSARTLEELRAAGAREQEFLEAYERWARTDPSGLGDEAPRIVLAGGPYNEKMALLRVLQDVRHPAREDAFRSALLSPRENEPEGQGAVRRFAVRFLGEACVEDPVSKRVLRDAVWSPRGGLPEELRRRGAGHYAAAIDAEELRGLAQLLNTEADAAVVRSVVAAVARRLGTEEAVELATDLGMASPEPEPRAAAAEHALGGSPR